MAKTIDFCVPFIATGVEYLEYLARNLCATAREPDRVRLLVSYHNDEDRQALAKANLPIGIHAQVHAPAVDKNVLFYPSANHSRAINALAAQASSDLVVFSDYDMIFCRKDWDVSLEELCFAQGVDMCGVTYPNRMLHYAHPALLQQAPWLERSCVIKYQQTPNLSFFCLRQDVLRNIFERKMTSFDEFLTTGGFPFRIINTPSMAAATRLRLGCIQWLDTGWEIPHAIEQHGLRHHNFQFTSLQEQKVFSNTEEFDRLDPLLQPEFFHWDNEPFLCHYKKGSAKSKSGQCDGLFRTFTQGVEDYLSKAQGSI